MAYQSRRRRDEPDIGSALGESRFEFAKTQRRFARARRSPYESQWIYLV